jgi:hypothetical protein
LLIGPAFGGNLYVTGNYHDGTKQVPCYWTLTGTTITRTDLAGDGVHDAL